VQDNFRGIGLQAPDGPRAVSGEIPLACHLPAFFDEKFAAYGHSVRSEALQGGHAGDL
jgi:hypothetical protein